YLGFEWIDFGDYSNSVVSFIRKAKDPEDFIVCIFNFTPVPRLNYRVGVPAEGFYKEVLNSDSEAYWGGNIGNWGGFHADHTWWQGRPFSLCLQIPPLGAVFMKHVRPLPEITHEQQVIQHEEHTETPAEPQQAVAPVTVAEVSPNEPVPAQREETAPAESGTSEHREKSKGRTKARH
ncbi:MAG: alpha amylase C-terminal domain-containing protein, partial [Nitrospirae bacterium]|nr:alpha amylase C-terminal domain-containing protein [Nitrospirota bacterium]